MGGKVKSTEVYLNGQIQKAVSAYKNCGPINWEFVKIDKTWSALNVHDEITVEYTRPDPKVGDTWIRIDKTRGNAAVCILEDRGVSSTTERLFLVEIMKTGEHEVIGEYDLSRQISEMEALAWASQ